MMLSVLAPISQASMEQIHQMTNLNLSLNMPLLSIFQYTNLAPPPPPPPPQQQQQKKPCQGQIMIWIATKI